MKKKYNGRIFYGWYIVLAGAIIMAADIGIVINCASLFIKPIAEDLGFSRAAVSMNQTIISFCHMIAAFFAGKIFAREDLGKIVKIAFFFVCGGYFCYSFATDLPVFYLISMVVGFAYSILGVLCFSVVISNWFVDKRGRAIGLCFMGTGVGGMIFNYFAGHWMEMFGWRMTYRILSVCLVVIMAPFVFWVLKIKPSDMGLEPYGAEKEKLVRETSNNEGMTFKEALRSPSLWTLCFAGAIMSACTNTTMQTIAPNLTDIGYTPVFAATMVSIGMGALALGKLCLGQLYDVAGAKRATFVASASVTLGLIGMYFSHFKAALPLIFFGTGPGAAFGSVAIPIIAQTVFGRKEYTSIYGFLSGTNSLILVLMPTINSLIYDHLGSYDICYIVMGILSVAAVYIYWSFFSKIEKGKI